MLRKLTGYLLSLLEMLLSTFRGCWFFTVVVASVAMIITTSSVSSNDPLKGIWGVFGFWAIGGSVTLWYHHPGIRLLVGGLFTGFAIGSVPIILRGAMVTSPLMWFSVMGGCYIFWMVVAFLLPDN